MNCVPLSSGRGSVFQFSLSGRKRTSARRGRMPRPPRMMAREGIFRHDDIHHNETTGVSIFRATAVSCSANSSARHRSKSASVFSTQIAAEQDRRAGLGSARVPARWTRQARMPGRNRNAEATIESRRAHTATVCRYGVRFFEALLLAPNERLACDIAVKAAAAPFRPDGAGLKCRCIEDPAIDDERQRQAGKIGGKRAIRIERAERLAGRIRFAKLVKRADIDVRCP